MPYKTTTGYITMDGKQYKVEAKSYIPEEKGVVGKDKGSFITPSVRGAVPEQSVSYWTARGLSQTEAEKVVEWVKKTNRIPYEETVKGIVMAEREKEIERKEAKTITKQVGGIKSEEISTALEKKPVLTYEPAKKVFSYKEWIKEKPYVSGTLGYISEKAGAGLATIFAGARGERGAGREKSIAELGKKGGRYAPYAIPYVGGVIIAAESVELLATEKGRRELGYTAEFVTEKTGMPTLVSKPLVYAGTAGIGVLGGIAAFASFEKAIGYPKIETKFLGVSQRIEPSKEGIRQIKTDVLMQVKTKKLLTTEWGIAKARTITPYIAEEGKILGRAKTIGVYQKIKGVTVTGKVKLAKPMPYTSVEYGIAKPTKLRLEIKKEGMIISKEFPGMRQISFGEITAVKKITPGKVIGVKGRYAGVGDIYKITPRMSLIAGGTGVPGKKPFVFERAGRGLATGLIYMKPSPAPAGEVIGKSLMKLKYKTPLITTEVLKAQQVTGGAVGLVSKPKAFITPIGLPRPRAILRQQQVTGKTIGLVSKPKLKLQQVSIVTQAPKVRERLGLKLVQPSRVKQELALGLRQLSALVSKEKLASGLKSRLATKLAQTQRTVLRQRAVSKAALIQVPFMKAPEIKMPSGIFLPPPAFKLPFFPAGKRLRTPQLRKQPKRYTPSLAASAFKIKAFKIPKLYKLGFGGLIRRPIIKHKRKRR